MSIAEQRAVGFIPAWSLASLQVSYVKCERCEWKRCHVEENRGQGVISNRQKWCGCQKRKEMEAARPKEGKVQQDSAWPRKLEGVAKKKGSQRKVRRTF